MLAQIEGLVADPAVRVVAGAGSTWIHVIAPQPRPLPTQGWKLHVSATLATCDEVLQRLVPLLCREVGLFKVVRDRAVLAELNEGAAGLSQIGKFLTAYPADDADAVRLAHLLDAATRGLDGPVVPSDRRLRPDSVVSYRYGGFGARFLQTALGETLPALERPDGTLTADRRTPRFEPPSWAVDPFGAPAPDDAPALVGGRYYLVETLHASARGAVHLAVDVQTVQRCVVKRANRGATERLRAEVALLGRMAGDPRFPSVYEAFEDGGELSLAMEDVAGTPLDEHLRLTFATGTPSDADVVALGRELAGLLGAVHARGLVHRDVKGPNVLVTAGGQLRLVDFE
ncbi:MAG: phosphotransferase, partial [Myxococcota bacterium]